MLQQPVDRLPELAPLLRAIFLGLAVGFPCLHEDLLGGRVFLYVRNLIHLVNHRPDERPECGAGEQQTHEGAITA